MKLVSIFTLGLTLFSSAIVLGSPEFFRKVDQPISAALIPEGFDNNDSVELVIEGTFKNNCFQVGIVDTELDEEAKRLNISFSAYEYTGTCSDYPVKFHQVVRVGLLSKAGTYAVYNKRPDEKFLGALKIGTAEGGTGTDEANYAPLLDAFLHVEEGQNVLHLSGQFTSSCLEVKSVDVKPFKNVVVVLPKIGPKEGATCTIGEFPLTYTHVVKEELPKGRYLLHVRSTGGEAINKIMVK